MSRAGPGPAGMPAACPACGGSLAPWRSVASGEPSDPARYSLARCGTCGTAVTLGPPPGAELYESGTYDPSPPRARLLVRSLQRVTVAQPVRMLRQAGLGKGARVLDAGAGKGRLVGALGDAGFDARGIEPGGRAGAAPEASGLRIERATIEEHTDEGLDAVVLWHVLEHLDDPAGAVRRVRGWLRPGGVLLIGVPNAASWQARIAGPGWLHWDSPRHRTHFTPRGLDALLRSCELTPERTAHMVWEHNPWAMWMALLTRAGARPGLLFHVLKRTLRPTPREVALLALGMPVAPAAVALEAGAAVAGRGGTIAVLARAR